MNHQALRNRLAGLATLVGWSLLASAPASAQFTFSVDYFGATIAAPDGFGAVPITEGDLLTPVLGVPALGPLAVPGIDVSGGATGLGLAIHPSCVGHPAGTPCAVEVDALSYGRDRPAHDVLGFRAGEIWFSTDPFAGGFVAGPAPDVTTEGPCADLAADVMATAAPMVPGPLPPFASVGGNTALIDGDGLASACGIVYPGVGLVEPTFPALPPFGDNLDALNFDAVAPPGGFGFPATGIYFSLDGFAVHPITGMVGTGSAAAHGFFAADILYTAAPGGPPIVWAPAPALGLNLAGGLDDLDALAIHENGTGFFEPSIKAYDWMTGATDMVLFSVRLGSPVIGMPDSTFGIPIAAGDILTTPLPTSSGGVSPFPSIFIAAENLGLIAVRVPGGIDDDLNALDLLDFAMVDCNGNGIDDQIDINSGTSTDINGNFVPDECEIVGGPVCYCPTGSAPCGNPDPTAGCRNSTGVGGLLSAAGSGSVFLDNLVLTASQLPTFQFGLFFGGASLIGPFPFGDGLRCVGGGITRVTTALSTGATGTIVAGPGIAGGAGYVAFQTVHFQCWYRDPGGPCASGFNATNAYSVTFTP